MIAIGIILTALVIFLSAIYWHQTRSRFAKLLNRFPQMKHFIPVLGNFSNLSLKQDVLFTQVREFVASFKETFSGWAGIYGTLHIVTADDAEIIISNVKYIDKGIIYEFFNSWLGTGLLTSTGTKWHQRRKMLTPAFHYNILQMFVEVFGEQCNKLTNRLKDECKKSRTDIQPIIKEMTLKTICETSMGIKLDKNVEQQGSYYDSINSIAEIIIKRAFSPWLHPNITYYISPTYWKEMSLIKTLHSFTNKIIKNRRETFQDNDVTYLESTDKKPKKRLAMLDLLIYENRHFGKIDDEGIREEVDTFVFEGHDTTSVGTCFALLLLAHHPDVQHKIIEEMNEIFGDSQRHATYADLQNMKYLECCIKESLRLYPSVPLIVRNIKEDVQLTHHVAPAGAEIFIHIYNIHRDPKYFPNPEKFDPDRFLPENSVGRHPYAYIPFSAGPRNCIGQKFAMLELKSIISSVLRNFTMEPIDSAKDLAWVIDLVLRVRGPIYIKFKSRI